MYLSRFVLLAFIPFCSPLYAESYSPLDALPSGSRASLHVETLNQEITQLSTHNQTQYFPPASTLKIITALAAKLELAENFRFETDLLVAKKDIEIRFQGDPTLTTDNLKQLFAVAKRNGLTKIEGDIWLDNSAFTGYDRAVGWPWDILGVCYSAPATAISLDENCVQASIYTQDDGATRVYVPDHFPIYVTTHAISVTQQQQELTQCDLELISSPDNHYQLQGCLGQRSKPLPLKFAVQDPELYTQRMINSILNQLSIPFTGQVRIGQSADSNKKTLASHRSAPLNTLLEEMLKKSDNLIADNLTKTLGATFYVQPGSFSNGTKAIKQIIFTNTGINLDDLPMEDGSGLSRNNRFSSEKMTQVLRYIWQNEQDLQLIALLPKAGESGTLKYRRSMRKAPIKGAITAKSGSVYGSYNMAGYGLDSEGSPNTLFVQFIADYHPRKRKSDEPKVVAPLTQFEHLFYQDIVKFSQAMPKK